MAGVGGPQSAAAIVPQRQERTKQVGRTRLLCYNPPAPCTFSAMGTSVTELSATSPATAGERRASPAFAHAAEEEFARLLDFFGVPWQYEPRTFVLRTDSAGQPIVAFTPDFYLPEEDLYVEITTVRPKQVRRKNRKLRWLNEQYPQIRVKLYKRSDFRQLMAKHGLDDAAHSAWIAVEGREGDAEDAPSGVNGQAWPADGADP